MRSQVLLTAVFILSACVSEANPTVIGDGYGELDTEITYSDGLVRDGSEATGDCMRLDVWQPDGLQAIDGWSSVAVVTREGALLTTLNGEARDWVMVDSDGLTDDGQEVFCSAVGHIGPSSYVVPEMVGEGWYRACRFLGDGCSEPFEHH